MGETSRFRLAAVVTLLALPLWAASCFAGGALGARPGDWPRAWLAMFTFVLAPVLTTCAAAYVAPRTPSTPLRWGSLAVVVVSLNVAAFSLCLGWQLADPQWSGLHDEEVGRFRLPALAEVSASRVEGDTGELLSTEGGVTLDIRWFPASWSVSQVGLILDGEAPGSKEETWEYDPADQSWNWPHGAAAKGWDGAGRAVPCGSVTFHVLVWAPEAWASGLLDAAVPRLGCDARDPAP